jgi:outer membrane protein, heavy metal efflux system
MHRRLFSMYLRPRGAGGAHAIALLALCVAAAGVRAQSAAPPAASPLREAFDAAWARQPEAAALSARRDAVRAQQASARAWSPQPAALEITHKTDRLNRNLGTRETELGVAVPLWLPGERGGSLALAEAEARAVESRWNAAQLRIAASVREAWWNWQRARADAETARAQQASASRIAADVAKRLKAGELARADQHQADGAVAAADAAVAQADAAATAAQLHLRALTAWPNAQTVENPSAEAEPEPQRTTAAALPDAQAHAELAALKDKAAVAQSSAALTATQSRANPELIVAATRDRGAFGDTNNQTFTIGIRVPFGGGPRHDTRSATARADVLELQAQLALEQARLAAERDAARARTEAARTQLAAAERRALLARESRGFFDKSFRLGETDLPTRLRIEAEAADAERQAARARIELAAAVSTWRQALGLLPQ